MEVTKLLLREIEDGKNRFEPVSSSPNEIRNFQAIAKRLKSAHEKKLLRKAYFQVSRSRVNLGMFIAVLTHGGLTFEGEQYLDGTHEEFRKNEMKTQNININSPSSIQIGDSNTQQITIVVQSLIEKIENSNGSDLEKSEAKSLLQKFLKHPLVAAVVGATINLG